MHRKTVSILAAASLIGGLFAAVVAGPAQAQTPPVNVTNFHPADNASFPAAAFDTGNPGGDLSVDTFTQCNAGAIDPIVCAFGGTTVTGAGHDFADQLSDKPDGTDALAHLTTVTTQDAERVEWYVCNPNVTGPDEPAVDNDVSNEQALTQAELTGACILLPGATNNPDTTGRVPASGPSAAPFGEAYDTLWNIPQELDRQVRDIAALACVGTGTRVETTGGQQPNCRADVENNVSLDDAQTTTPAAANVSPQTGEEQTSAAEMVSICTSDPDLTGGADLCEISSTEGATPAQTREQLEARFRPFLHGSPVPNEGFVLRATTSRDVTDLDAGILSPAGANGIQASFVGFTSCNTEETFPTHFLVECTFQDDDVPDNQELDVLVFDDGDPSGAGFCDRSETAEGETTTGPNTPDPDPAVVDDDPDGFDETTCQLDAHYAVSQQRGPATSQASFQPNAATGSPTTTAGTPACDAGEQQDKAETNAINAPTGTGGGAAGTGSEIVVLCLVDQFGDRMVNARVTFEVNKGQTGATQFTACSPGETAGAGGVLHDHDNDGLNEHCHTTTDADGEASARFNNVSIGTAITARPGDAVITACFDPQFNTTDPSAGAQPPQHGCADATAEQRDSVTKTYLALPTHVHLVYAGSGTAADPCHTGEKFRENTIGQSDTLLVCTMDANNNPATTAQAEGGTIQWIITTAAGGQTQLATRFAANPPNETDTQGRATAQIQAVNEGTDLISVRLLNENAQLVASDFVEKRVRRAGETQPPTTAPGTATATATSTATSTVTINPSPSVTLNPRTVTLEASKNKKTFGREVALSGGISSPVSACVGNQTVVIRRTVVGTSTSQVFATLVTNADGTFSHSFDADVSANYIAHLDPTANCAEANSDPTPVNVRVAVNLRVSKQIIRRGGTVRLNAQVLPCGDHAGTRVILFQLIAGDFVKVGRATLSGNCTASFTRTIRRNTAFQARWPKQDEDHLAGRSRKKAVRVGRR